MGMFDYVTYRGICPNCGYSITDWQSKDSGCMMDKIQYWEVNNFYGSCNKCNAWIEFVREPKEAPITDYKIYYRLEGDKEFRTKEWDA